MEIMCRYRRKNSDKLICAKENVNQNGKEMITVFADLDISGRRLAKVRIPGGLKFPTFVRHTSSCTLSLTLELVLEQT